MVFRLRTFRLIPVLVCAAALSLSVRLGDLWFDLGDAVGSGAGVALAADPGGPGAGAAPTEGLPSLGPASAPPGSDQSQPALPQADRQEGPPGFVPWTIATSGTDDDAMPQPAAGPAEPDAAAEQEVIRQGSDEELAAVPGLQPPADGIGFDPEAGARPDRLVASLPDPYDFTDEEISLLQQLSERREQIERQRREVSQREALLAAAEARVEQKVSELEELRRVIEELVILHDEQEEAQLRSLVKIYENMKPKEAARIFEQLDMVVLLEVIDRMKERKAAPVLARMSPDRAQEITLELAQRRNLPIEKE